MRTVAGVRDDADPPVAGRQGRRHRARAGRRRGSAGRSAAGGRPGATAVDVLQATTIALTSRVGERVERLGRERAGPRRRVACRTAPGRCRRGRSSTRRASRRIDLAEDGQAADPGVEDADRSRVGTRVQRPAAGGGAVASARCTAIGGERGRSSWLIAADRAWPARTARPRCCFGRRAGRRETTVCSGRRPIARARSSRGDAAGRVGPVDEVADLRRRVADRAGTSSAIATRVVDRRRRRT